MTGEIAFLFATLAIATRAEQRELASQIADLDLSRTGKPYP